MNKLLAGGCSITHGLETVSQGYDVANTEFSYARYLADHYQAEYCNVAYPGASNELIFHRLVSQLLANDYTHCVVGWTGLHRESWEKDNVVWRFSLNYGECTDNNVAELPFIKRHPTAALRANQKSAVGDVLRFWETIKIKLLNDSQEQKLTHYRSIIQLVCNQKGIELIELSAIVNDQPDLLNLETVGSWKAQKRHPSREEHINIYNAIISHEQA